MHPGCVSYANYILKRRSGHRLDGLRVDVRTIPYGAQLDPELAAIVTPAPLPSYGPPNWRADIIIYDDLNTMTNPTDRIKQAQAELEAAIKAKQEQDVKDAEQARFNHDRGLAASTLDLIVLAANLKLGNLLSRSVDGPRLATFRKELQPLAESYGVRIVLTGDKTTATVVLQ